MKIFLAALYSSPLKKNEVTEICTKYGCKYGLDTFTQPRSCERAISLFGVDNFILDSGAFSFMHSKQLLKEDIDKYVSRYIKFIKQHNIKNFMELDIDTIYDLNLVKNIRNKIEYETQKKVIPVWHKERGIQEFLDDCENYEYIAIGGLVSSVRKRNLAEIKKMCFYAYSKNVKVHCLGLTDPKILKDIKLYSTDSTSWDKEAINSKNVLTFNGHEFIKKKINQGNKKVNINLITQRNLVAWIKYQRYMDKAR